MRTSRVLPALLCLLCAFPSCDRAGGGGDPESASASVRADVRHATGPTFADCAREAGLDFRHDRGATPRLQLFEIMGGGAAWLDHDRDGDPDLYLTSGQALRDDGAFPSGGKNRLYRNDRGRFVDVTRAAGVEGRGYAMGAAAGDYDNDGYPDLYVVCYGRNILYHNLGNGAFEEVKASGIDGADPFSGAAVFGDFDGDGLPDLFLGSYVVYDHRNPERCTGKDPRGRSIHVYCGPVNFDAAPDRLYRNLGGGSFRDVSREARIGQGADARSKSLGAVAADLDGDGDLDLYVACDTTPNLLYRNRGDGVFDEVGMELGVAASDEGAYEGSMGIALGDADGDRSADLFVTNFQDESNRLYLGSDAGPFTDGTTRTGVGLGSRPLVGWGTGFLDAGCDGRPDLFVANGHTYHNAEEWLPEKTYRQRNLLYAREGRGQYRERGQEAGEAFRRLESYRGAAFADFDLDGDVDILVTALDAAPQLLRSEGPRGHWLEVDLVGSGPGGRDAVGARVEVQTPSGRQVRWRHGGGSYLCESEARLHFGLGTEALVERLTVHWPGGGTTALESVAADRRIVVERR